MIIVLNIGIAKGCRRRKVFALLRYSNKMLAGREGQYIRNPCGKMLLIADQGASKKERDIKFKLKPYISFANKDQYQVHQLLLILLKVGDTLNFLNPTMAIRYSLQPNKTRGAKPGEYRAMVKHIGTLTLEDLAQQLQERHRMIHTSVAKMVLSAFFELVADRASDGYAINTPIFNLFIGVKGKFEDPSDQFYPNRHEVTLNCSTNKALKKRAKKLRAYKIKSTRKYPTVTSVYDFHSDTINTTITPGNVIQVKGYYLKLDPDKEDEELYFQHENGDKYKPEQLFKNTTSELLLVLPDSLPAGKYELHIANRAGSARHLRESVFQSPLITHPR